MRYTDVRYFGNWRMVISQSDQEVTKEWGRVAGVGVAIHRFGWPRHAEAGQQLIRDHHHKEIEMLP
jgi:hypothetical protein